MATNNKTKLLNKSEDVTSIEEYKKFVKHEKNRVKFYRILIVVLFLITWEVTARVGIIDSFLFSSPTQVSVKFYELVTNGELVKDTIITFTETIVAFVFSTLLGILLGIGLWYFESLKKIIDPYLVLLNSIPKTAIAPIIIVWFGIGYKAIIVVAISIGIFATIMAYISAINEVDVNKIKLIYVLGGTRKDVLTKVILPYSIPSIIMICKINIGLSLIGVIIGEFLVAQHGLGYRIIYGSQIFDLDSVILSLCILSCMATVFYWGIERLEIRFRR